MDKKNTVIGTLLIVGALVAIYFSPKPTPPAPKPVTPIVTASAFPGDEPDNIVGRCRMVKGDAGLAMKSADVIVEHTYKTQFIDHAYLEPEAGIAWVDENGVLTIRVSTQVVEHFRAIANALQMPQNKVHIMGGMVGGGFGFQMGRSLKFEKVPHNRLHLALAQPPGQRSATR